MNNSRSEIRPGFIAFFFGFICVAIIIALLAPIYIGGKPIPVDVAKRDCKNYLAYAKFASTNGVFNSDFSKTSEFGRAEWLRPIFNTNQNYWGKTNFRVGVLNPELVIICTQQFYYPRSKNTFGCSYSRLKPAFVVGYSDGTVTLISQEQFTNLSLNNFVPFSAQTNSLGLNSTRQP